MRLIEFPQIFKDLLYLRSYSVPDFEVLADFVDFELTDFPLMDPGVLRTLTRTSHL